jgi:hypothetical protein
VIGEPRARIAISDAHALVSAQVVLRVPGEENSMLAAIGGHERTLPAKVGNEQENGIKSGLHDWPRDHQLLAALPLDRPSEWPKVQQLCVAIDRAVFGLS